jgi:hypothetical protein
MFGAGGGEDFSLSLTMFSSSSRIRFGGKIRNSDLYAAFSTGASLYSPKGEVDPVDQKQTGCEC